MEELIRHERRRATHMACRSDMSMTHRNVLMLLDAQGSMPMSGVAEMLSCSMPNVTGVIDRMEERGLVQRHRDSSDRRLVMVEMTADGRAALGDMETMRSQHLRRILGAMSETDQRLCLRAFRRIRETAERMDTEPATTPVTT